MTIIKSFNNKLSVGDYCYAMTDAAVCATSRTSASDTPVFVTRTDDRRTDRQTVCLRWTQVLVTASCRCDDALSGDTRDDYDKTVASD